MTRNHRPPRVALYFVAALGPLVLSPEVFAADGGGATAIRTCETAFATTADLARFRTRLKEQLGPHGSELQLTSLDLPFPERVHVTDFVFKHGDLVADIQSQRSRPRLVSMREAALTSIHRSASDPTAELSSLRSNLKELNTLASDVASMMFERALPAYATPSIRVFTHSESKSLKNSRSQAKTRRPHPHETALQVGKTLTEFDETIAPLGFSLPPTTHVYLARSNEVLKQRHGPYCITRPLWGPRRGSSDATIHLLPLGTDTAVISAPAALIHERTHSVLHHNYSKSAFFLLETSPALEEALADFMAAHFTNSPAITGANRHLEIPYTGARGGFAFTRNLFRDDVPDAPYLNSLAYSGVLWKIRQALGKEEMSRHLRPLFDALAKTNGPYTGFLSTRPADIEHTNLRHFLRTLADYYRENPTALAVVEEAAKANLFTLNGLKTISVLEGEPPADLGLRDTKSPLEPATGIMITAAAKEAAVPSALASTLGAILYIVLDDEE